MGPRTYATTSTIPNCGDTRKDIERNAVSIVGRMLKEEQQKPADENDIFEPVKPVEPEYGRSVGQH
jgi:hypothetical protein